MASWRPLPGVVRSQRALTVSLVQSSCRRYQPRGGGQGPALEGCSEEVGVADGGRCEGRVPRVRGGGLDGLPGSCASTSTYGWPWQGLARLGVSGWLIG